MLTTIRLGFCVEKIDKGAYGQLTNLIMRYLLMHRNTGDVNIWKDRIIFSRLLITRGTIPFAGNDLECRDRNIYFTGKTPPQALFPGEAYNYLYNIMYSLKGGYMSKFSLDMRETWAYYHSQNNNG